MRTALLLLMALGTAQAPVAPPKPGQKPTVSERIRSAGLPGAGPEDLRRWPEGPVRYILRRSEVDLYRSLKTDLERRLFIQEFWLRRDPSPQSLQNEYRESFWRRVMESNDLFTRSSEPGWKTDRGRIYLLLGPPDAIDREVMPNRRSGRTVSAPSPTPSDPRSGESETGGGNHPSVGESQPMSGGTQGGNREVMTVGADPLTEGFLGVERWTYSSAPAPTLPPQMVLAFRQTPSGEYELSSNPKDLARTEEALLITVPPLDKVLGVDKMTALAAAPEAPGRMLPPNPVRAAVLGQVGADLVTPQPATADPRAAFEALATLGDLGKLPQAPSFGSLLQEFVTSEEFLGLLPLVIRDDYYKGPGGKTLAVLTLGVRRESLMTVPATQGPELLVGGRIEKVAAPEQVLVFSGPESIGSAPDNPESDLLLYQTVAPLQPGDYTTRFGLYDPSGNRVGSSEKRLQVPAFPATDLALSSIVVTRRAPRNRADQGTPAEGSDALRTGPAPFRLGGVEVIPRTESRFSPGEELSIYYQIYGAAPDPATGQPRFDVTYRFFTLVGEGFEPYGKPFRLEGRTGSAQGWTLPLGGFRAGTFKLEVSVEDRLRSGAAMGQVLFSVVRESPASEDSQPQS